MEYILAIPAHQAFSSIAYRAASYGFVRPLRATDIGNSRHRTDQPWWLRASEWINRLWVATGISFANASGTTVSGSSGAVSSYGAGSGSFLGCACSNSTSGCGTVHEIASFGSIQGMTNQIVLSSLSAVAINFDLGSLSSVSHSTNFSGGALSFTAKGTIKFTGYDPTTGTLILTADGNNISSYSAVLIANPMPTETATSVAPEPSSMVLMGTDLLGVLGAARRRFLA